MKPRKSITLEIPLPQISGGILNQTGFKRHLADAAIKQLPKTLNEAWVQDQYILFLKAEEHERREKFKKQVAELKAGKTTAPVATPPTASAPTANIPRAGEQPVASTSKKAPVAITGKDENGHE